MEKRNFVLYIEKGNQEYPQTKNLDTLHLVENGKVIATEYDGSDEHPVYGTNVEWHGRQFMEGFKQCLRHLGVLGIFITEELPEGVTYQSINKPN